MGRIPAELQPLINKMTNWQRNQWARTGYPIKEEAVRVFLMMRRDGKVAAPPARR